MTVCKSATVCIFAGGASLDYFSCTCPHLPWDVRLTNYQLVRVCVCVCSCKFVHVPCNNAIQGIHSVLVSPALTVAQDINIDYCPVNKASQLIHSDFLFLRNHYMKEVYT